MKKITNLTKRFWKDESAQGMTEYILLLVIVVGLVMMFKENVRNILETKIKDLGRQITSVTGGQ